jgi:hypothetical protein
MLARSGEITDPWPVPLTGLEHARLQPFLDQADDARITDPMFNETDHPFLVNHVERSHDRLPITKTFRSPPSSRANGIRLKDADFLSSGA